MKLMKIYHDKVIGAIKGFDRIRFRGTIRWLANEVGMNTFLRDSNILLKDFAGWAEAKTKALRLSCEKRAIELGIEMQYLKSGAVDKEKVARAIAEKHNISNAPICMFSVVEPCIAPTVKGNRETKKLELKMTPRKCVFIYHYFDHPEIGFGHVRLQTWLPMNIHICINGRHWLEKQLNKNNIAYIKEKNCFPWIEDINAAQKIMDTQLQTSWTELLESMTLHTCPALKEVLSPFSPTYYWSADETEWATDIMFRSTPDLEKLYPGFIKHAMMISDSPSVMRFFGKRNITNSGKIHGVAADEIISDYRKRYEGVRAKHWINHNSVKMYNKSGNILRLETTINNTRDFKVYRHPDDDKTRPKSWQKLRKGVADLHRRTQVSDKCNSRYADAIASAQVTETLQEVVGNTCNAIRKNGKRFRALNPWNIDDYKLLAFLGKGELAVNGFRNKDLRNWLYPHEGDTIDKKEKQRLAGRTTRRIRLLRGHGLIRKSPYVNRYVLTEKGQKFSTALLSASSVEVKELMELAS